MNIRDAYLSAADSIEAFPELFSFASIYYPDLDCGTPGCGLGWVNYHLGTAHEKDDCALSEHIFSVGLTGHPAFEGLDDADFYERMSNINWYWTSNAGKCASTLRKYADIYHPVLEGVNHEQERSEESRDTCREPVCIAG